MNGSSKQYRNPSNKKLSKGTVGMTQFLENWVPSELGLGVGFGFWVSEFPGVNLFTRICPEAE